MGDIYVHGGIISKQSKNKAMRKWTGFNWLWIKPSGEFLGIQQ
jgi:hypothetical protein